MKIAEHFRSQINLFDTQKDVAGKYDISEAMVSYYINDRAKLPSLKLARKVYELDRVVLYPYSKEAISSSD